MFFGVNKLYYNKTKSISINIKKLCNKLDTKTLHLAAKHWTWSFNSNTNLFFIQLAARHSIVSSCLHYQYDFKLAELGGKLFSFADIIIWNFLKRSHVMAKIKFFYGSETIDQFTNLEKYIILLYQTIVKLLKVWSSRVACTVLAVVESSTVYFIELGEHYKYY